MYGWLKKLFSRPLDRREREEALYEDALRSEWVAIDESVPAETTRKPELRAVEDADLFMSRVYSSQET